MHKDEASILFGALSKAPSVKITKILYNNDKLYLEDLLNIFKNDNIVLADYLIPLVNCNLVKKEFDGEQDYFVCNKELLDELMAFFKKRCHCCDKKDN